MDRRHPFEDVDGSEEPARWGEVLERFHTEPFYRAYKARVRELLAPRPGGLYLEVGSGTGRDAASLGARALGVDRSRTLCRQARECGVCVLVAAAEALPFASGRVDGCWADRVFQHLADPETALREMLRVTRPGGCVVVVDPDYESQVVDHPEPALARRVLAWRAERSLRNGGIAHRMPGLFASLGLVEVCVEPHTVVVRDPTALDQVLGLRTWARAAARAGELTDIEAERWERGFDEAVARDAFLWSVSFFITRGRKPGARSESASGEA